MNLYRYTKNRVLPIGMVIAILSLNACKKFVVADVPNDRIVADAVFANNTSAAAVMTSVYIGMKANLPKLSDGGGSIGLLFGLSADELKNYDPSIPIYSQFYTNSITPQVLLTKFWDEIYQQLHVVNTVIEGVEKSGSLSANVKQQLTGEAKFMRAFLHFQATNLYGKAPLVLTSDYRVNILISRSDSADIYKQIIQDLKDAQNLLPESIVDGIGAPSLTRVRPNKWAATALLARVCLYIGDWANAEKESAKFIGNATYNLDPDMNKVFLATSTEAIWQLQTITAGYNTFDGNCYVLTAAPGAFFKVAMSEQLKSAFENGDARFSNWVEKFSSGSTDYYYPYKYKIGSSIANTIATEYTVVLRTAEQYLISAEAKIRQDRIAEGIADLNKLRDRSRLMPTVEVPDPLPAVSTSLSKEDAIKAVLHERRVELFTEWGHRWFDLKRTGNLNAIMDTLTPMKGSSTWSPYKALLPIPISEIQLNPNLTQTPGYN
jgi:starch-binding outer membrane protein, SusD/RagB family